MTSKHNDSFQFGPKLMAILFFPFFLDLEQNSVEDKNGKITIAR